MPSARALRSNLHSLALAPITAAIPIAFARRLAARCACKEGGQVRGILSEAVPRGDTEGVRAGGENYATPLCCPIVSHVLGPATLKGPPVAALPAAWPKKL